ncbi:sensor domain-containing phosphodiesterase [Luteimonas sp. SJ-92]|uniref:Sensor domain-containing phosphodiesterase n=1 Tax=Luteimonas salinisoli TaxID=2752307 RepID=A0A853JCU2_9GAMM|nr:sensor domain-containing phosphodiesterase [Luteimonas salinisoli]NZA26447.1 sensor domain-containing phosphodiesterase [Luteimonas salinisoli]
MQPLSGPRMKRVFLATRFGRRIFLMFCLAALMPAIAVFWMTWRAASEDAEAAATRGLHEANKSYALGVFQRLHTARQALAAADPEALLEGADGEMLSMFFSDVMVADAPDGSAPLRSGGFAERLRASGIPPRSELMVVAPAVANRAHDVVLLRRFPGNGRGNVIAGRLDRAYLWGNPEEIGNAVRICVQVEDGAWLFCGGEREPGGDGARRIETEWNMFIKPHFGAPSWIFTATTEASDALAHFSRFVAPVMVGILLLAMLLSSLQIRRVVGPLEVLLGRIRAFGGGGERIRATVGDEFGLLSDTFDEMRARITQQLDTLRVLSQIDHLILARVPLEEVIELVLDRVVEVAGGAGVCVVLAWPEDGRPAECHARGRGAGRTSVAPLPAVPPVLQRMSPREGAGGVVLSSGELGPALPRDGDAGPGPAESHAWAIALGGEGETRVWLLLGREGNAQPAETLQGQVHDLAERIAVAAAFAKHQDLLLYQARHDLLTGLPNRLATFEALAAAIEEARPSARAFAVAFVDLDRFKAINDGLGHALGDDILVQSGERIRASLAPGDFVGRFGGDEFFVILRGASRPELVTAAMARMDEAFARPIVAGHREFHQRFSAGAAFFPRDGVEAGTLVRNADVAMYRAKQTGGARTAFFEAEMNQRAEERVQMENELRAAIQEGQIELHYQPRVDSRDDRIIGVEALARWMHPTRGVVPPDEFIGLAEECGLIEPLGKLVLDKACRQLAEWQRMGFELGVMGVNISGHQLRSGRLRGYVSEAIAANGIAPGRLELEVTETMLVLDSDSGMAQLQSVRELGVKVAIDDFGTGYSSLAYLTRLPSDTLKIDRAFVVDLQDGDAAVEAVVRSIIAIARDLGKGVVAEGLESMEQVRMLGAWGCHVIQGYVYARPLTANGITGILLNGGIVTPAGAPEPVATTGTGADT